MTLNNLNRDAMSKNDAKGSFNNASFLIIGISDNPEQELTAAAQKAIARGKVFSGGKRHYELMKSRLPQGAQWIEITVPLADVFK